MNINQQSNMEIDASEKYVLNFIRINFDIIQIKLKSMSNMDTIVIQFNSLIS